MRAGKVGVTLVELLVVVAIIGITAAVTGLAIGSLRVEEDLVHQMMIEARKTAVEEGRMVQLLVDTAGSLAPHPLLFLPDGRVLGHMVEEE